MRDCEMGCLQTYLERCKNRLDGCEDERQIYDRHAASDEHETAFRRKLEYIKLKRRRD